MDFYNQRALALAYAINAEHQSWAAFIQGDFQTAESMEAEAGNFYAQSEEARKKHLAGQRRSNYRSS